MPLNRPAIHPLLATRRSGVLLHPTSLPGRHGSGDLGEAALHFLDWLGAAGQSIWQILPLAPPGAGQSPYLSPSAFAGSPWLVDLDDLTHQGWLDALPANAFDDRRCDFDKVLPYRSSVLRSAWAGFSRRADPAQRESWRAFCAAEAHWLDDYALFMELDGAFGEPWSGWPAPLAGREATALADFAASHRDGIDFWKFVQWRFFEQWNALRTQAHRRGVHVLGDLPIFVAHHSADVWANRDLFKLDVRGQPRVVAGVPPDYFSATGQRWGNPVYDWSVMARDGYAWWRSRTAHQLRLADLVRFDHFRGFEAAWEIPAEEPTAVAGRWQAGPGSALFDALRAHLGTLPVVAEDLGLITDAVRRLRIACGFPGMRVLQFAFGDDASNPYLPHNYEPLTVAYTGTHDNDTTLGWWRSASDIERAAARSYLGASVDLDTPWAMVRAVSQSVANMMVVPMQDIIGLDGAHRMNTPGQTQGCWNWRFEWAQVPTDAASRLAQMVRAHGRS